MALPLKVRDLLVREAHLRLGRDAILPVLEAQRAARGELNKRKPGFFASREAKEAFACEAAEADEALRLLANGVAQLDRVEPHIRKLVIDAAEDHCRENHPEYLRALAVRAHRSDWERCFVRFGEKVYGLTQALGNVRNMATSGYERARQVYSQGALQAFLIAIEAAKALEQEICFANDVADVQARLLRDTRMEAMELPRLRNVSYSPWIAMLSSVPLAEAQPQFDRIIGELKMLFEQTIPTLREQVRLADASQREALDSYVLRVLEAMREEAATLVNPEETEASVADSERMLEELAKRSALGRLARV
jgi:hypothetical protein